MWYHKIRVCPLSSFALMCFWVFCKACRLFCVSVSPAMEVPRWRLFWTNFWECKVRIAFRYTLLRPFPGVLHRDAGHRRGLWLVSAASDILHGCCDTVYRLYLIFYVFSRSARCYGWATGLRIRKDFTPFPYPRAYVLKVPFSWSLLFPFQSDINFCQLLFNRSIFVKILALVTEWQLKVEKL